MLRLRAAILLLTLPATALAQGRPEVIPATHHDVSPPLREMPPGPRYFGALEAEPVRHIPSARKGHFGPDPVLQAPTGPTGLAAPATQANFDGIGNGFSGPQGTFIVQYAPPDTNGAVGPNHFVETVNVDFAVFNKSGTPLYGPVPTNTLWSGFAGNCAIQNDGDPIVAYDRIADRWIITQFQVSTTPFQQCVAVSTSGDPTGSYNRYAFNYPDGFPDYPKLGVWPDGYYISYNVFNNSGTSFLYSKACAFDRTNMLVGNQVNQICFNTTNQFGGLLPADLDGSQLPPAGAPNPLVALGTTNTNLAVWTFHADFGTPANATFTGPTLLTVPAYSEACSGGTCIPQSGINAGRLDSLADRLMYRAAYRNFGDHEAIVVNHAVTAGSSVGIRWYEIRGVTSTPTVFQSGTFAPDANYRWMGSMAMDRSGNIALGYSVSSSSIKPQIRYTGRLAGDAAGTMTQGEGTIVAGGGSQGRTLSRWGDYSSMSVDPADDCTFWYSNEYIPSNGTFNWRTRIASFKFPSCGGSATPDFSLSASPTTVTAVQGNSGTTSIAVTPINGFNGSVTFSVTTPLPNGASADFSPNPSTGASTLTLNAGNAAAGTYQLTVQGVSATLVHTTTVSFTITTPPPAPDFSLAASPTTVTAAQGNSGTTTITINPINGFNSSVNLDVTSGLPSGATFGFSPNPATGSSTLTLNAGSTTPTGTYTLTITGTSGALTHTTTVSFTVIAPASFSLSAPSSASVSRKSSTTVAIAIGRSAGFTGPVTLSVSGMKQGVTGSFNPPAPTGPSSMLTITAAPGAARGTFILTITGTSPGLPNATTTVTLTVN